MMNRRGFLGMLAAVPLAAATGAGLVRVHRAKIPNPIRGRHFDAVFLDDLVSPINSTDHEDAMRILFSEREYIRALRPHLKAEPLGRRK